MQETPMQESQQSSMLAGSNATYLESLFEQYLTDPSGLSPEWLHFFDNLPKNGVIDFTSNQIIERLQTAQQQFKTQGSHTGAQDAERGLKVALLVEAYRRQGHLHAQIDPLQNRQLPMDMQAELSLSEFGLDESALSQPVSTDAAFANEPLPLAELIESLQQTYCGQIGLEFMHIQSPEERNWWLNAFEGRKGQPHLSNELKKRILERLTAAEGLEKYLGAKYPGAKRFSLEGGDSLIPLLDELLHRATANGTREAVIGMAHRGRLNVLVNILGKNPSELFDEFEGKHALSLAVESGDVKYHQGFSSDLLLDNNQLHLAMAFNPSHLEIVTPVVVGSVRCRQTRQHDDDASQVLPIAMHGDAAFAGQGVVMETLNMSQTRGYGVGGTVHIVINNQVGFTTSNPEDARSTLYCTDVAKVVLAPILHVNADDPEAVVLAAQLAFDYRARFKKDVVIDLVCYRRHGHNEADEPSATQPQMYQFIRKHPTARQRYAEQLMQTQVLAESEAKQLLDSNRAKLDNGESTALNVVYDAKPRHPIDWAPHFSDDWRQPIKTGLSTEAFTELGRVLTTVPEGFQLHPRVARIVSERVKMLNGEIPCDWGFAENLSYASLLSQGFGVRLSGQDCGRGTFFHRHAVWHDQGDLRQHAPLGHLSPEQGHFEVIDSLLSEEAVMAFEYGYATTDPRNLVIWEAQFGDFANGAQVVIDQFISSGEQKWGRVCGMVLLLPHGYEGQGPEHSSARLERFLQLCAQHNLQVCTPTTAAQVFHMMRRQMMRDLRTPLVVMSPKSLLRLKAASSPLDEILNGQFQNIIESPVADASQVKQIILTSGKVVYDLLAYQETHNRSDVAIIRIEQLYPFPEEELTKALAKYPNASQVVWCQEEPKNQGAWYPSQHHIWESLAPHQSLYYAGRPASASPAVGYASLHVQQQKALIEQAFQFITVS